MTVLLCCRFPVVSSLETVHVGLSLYCCVAVFLLSVSLGTSTCWSFFDSLLLCYRCRCFVSFTSVLSVAFLQYTELGNIVISSRFTQPFAGVTPLINNNLQRYFFFYDVCSSECIFKRQGCLSDRDGVCWKREGKTGQYDPQAVLRHLAVRLCVCCTA